MSDLKFNEHIEYFTKIYKQYLGSCVNTNPKPIIRFNEWFLLGERLDETFGAVPLERRESLIHELEILTQNLLSN